MNLASVLRTDPAHISGLAPAQRLTQIESEQKEAEEFRREAERRRDEVTARQQQIRDAQADHSRACVRALCAFGWCTHRHV